MSEFTEQAKKLSDMLSEDDKAALLQVPAPCVCSATHGLHRCEMIKGHDGLCKCHCGTKWPNYVNRHNPDPA